MDHFYEGIVAGITMLGGLCAFIYWVFSLLEKRLETKIEGKFNQFDAKFEQIDGKFEHLETKIDDISSRLNEAIHEQAARHNEAMLEQANQRKRTDQLYQILIDLVQKQAPRTNP